MAIFFISISLFFSPGNVVAQNPIPSDTNQNQGGNNTGISSTTITSESNQNAPQYLLFSQGIIELESVIRSIVGPELIFNRQFDPLRNVNIIFKIIRRILGRMTFNIRLPANTLRGVVETAIEIFAGNIRESSLEAISWQMRLYTMTGFPDRSILQTYPFINSAIEVSKAIAGVLIAISIILGILGIAVRIHVPIQTSLINFTSLIFTAFMSFIGVFMSTEIIFMLNDGIKSLLSNSCIMMTNCANFTYISTWLVPDLRDGLYVYFIGSFNLMVIVIILSISQILRFIFFPIILILTPITTAVDALTQHGFMMRTMVVQFVQWVLSYIFLNVTLIIAAQYAVSLSGEEARLVKIAAGLAAGTVLLGLTIDYAVNSLKTTFNLIGGIFVGINQMIETVASLGR